MLRNTELADEKFKNIHSTRFRKLSEEFTKNSINELYCVVYDEKEDTRHWVKIKHTVGNKGVGTESWNAQQSTRFFADETGKLSEALQIIDFLTVSDTFDISLKNSLSNVNISTLERLIGSKVAKIFLGVYLKKGYLYSSIHNHKIEIERGLKKVVIDLLEGLTARDLDKKGDREKYIEAFTTEYTPDYSKKTISEWPLNSPEKSVLST